MVATENWIPGAIEVIKKVHFLHPNYEHTYSKLAAACSAIMKGELIVLIGPSRVGKTRCVQNALGVRVPIEPDAHAHMRVVIVEAGNDSTGGEFSTKAFMVACLRAIQHPIYGVADEDDPWEERLQGKLHRTPEGTLRAAFEKAIELRGTEYFVIDEGHHVLYAPGGDEAAARILDSYKCLANRTNVKLVLSGSYKLLHLLTLAPHMVGRQQPLEFPRYRAESRGDVIAWQQVLQSFSKCLVFEDGESLCSWSKYLFEGSHGCVGQLSRWLRATLANLLSSGGNAVTRTALERSRLPAGQEASILSEIVAGERQLIRITEALSADDVPERGASVPPSRPGKRKGKRRPFQRASRRNKVEGRT